MLRQERWCNTSEIRALVQKLPQPVGVYENHRASFEVYRVKDMSSARWPNPVLKVLLLDARTSYYVYGKRPRLDMYDAKAAIYLVRVRYFVHAKGFRIPIEAWMSNRFVPNEGSPRGAAELDIAYHGEKVLEKVVQEKFFKGERGFLKNILSYSRMCNIPPYASHAKDEKIVRTLGLKNPFSALCFSLTCEQFIRDYGDKKAFAFITGIIRDDLISNALTVRKKGQAFHPRFTPAHQFLKLPKSSVRLDRSIYTYKFPGYFLSIRELLRLFARLSKEGLLTRKTLQHYLGISSFSRSGRFHRLPYISKLGTLLGARGKIKYATISGETLRALVDAHVSDGPQLTIDDVSLWRKSITKVLKAGAVREVA